MEWGFEEDRLSLIHVKSQTQSLHISAKLGSRENVISRDQQSSVPLWMPLAIPTLPVLRAQLGVQTQEADRERQIPSSFCPKGGDSGSGHTKVLPLLIVIFFIL